MTLREFFRAAFERAMLKAGAACRSHNAKAFTEWCAWIAQDELRASGLIQ